MRNHPLYKLGDVVVFKSKLGGDFYQQGYIRAAIYVPLFNWFSIGDAEWHYYVTTRPNGWFIKRRKIICKA